MAYSGFNIILYIKFWRNLLSDLANVKDGYNRWSAVYDTNGNPMQALEDQHLVPLIGDITGKTTLDL